MASSQPLAEYNRRRDFAVTPEPAGSVDVDSPGDRFVVQRHRARRLHYDLRLELDGVLVSWAVPKGPTLDPSARRLAVHVEDHPLEYIDFEGVIPAGEYGGGDVIVWDRGRWAPAQGDEPQQALADGSLHFDLFGEKLVGRFVLVRKGAERNGKEQWLLLHKRDEQSEPGWDPEDHPRSVKSGRTNDEVAAEPAALWRSDADAAHAEIPLTASAWAAVTDEELAALGALGREGKWTIGERTVSLTNLDKVLFPPTDAEPASTKRDLIRYFAQMAPVMLPYLAGRPVNLHRYPNGVDQKGFWHKAVPSKAPTWMTRWRNDEADPGETEWYAVLDDPASLVWMANFGAVELHAWTSRLPDVHRPTWALIDIDPGERTSFDDTIVLARLYREALEHLDVVGLPKVTGKRGIQIWIPIVPAYTFDETRRWVETVSRAVGSTMPELISWAWRTDEREGLARLDYTQNAINKTLVAPYSTRAVSGAPVSVPIEWNELDDPDIRPDRWTLRTIGERIAATGDPFERLLTRSQRLPIL